MSYKERLKYWAICRLLPNQQWVIIARFHKRSDADGHVEFLQQRMPNLVFKVVFDVVEEE